MILHDRYHTFDEIQHFVDSYNATNVKKLKVQLYYSVDTFHGKDYTSSIHTDSKDAVRHFLHMRYTYFTWPNAKQPTRVELRSLWGVNNA